MPKNPRVEAARRRAERMSQADGRDPEDAAQRGSGDAGQVALERTAMVEMAIQQAIRQGAFDDLPGAGKPIPGLDRPHDPDWWIRRKIQTEKLEGLGPAALTLRVEDASMHARLDALTRESEVRTELEDFNHRVIEARRQLQGGPPVVTPTRDVDAEITAWRERRERARADARSRQAEASDPSSMQPGGRDRTAHARSRLRTLFGR